MSCHCSVDVSTGCTGAAGPFLLGGTYTGRLYSGVATLVCLDFAFLVFSVFLGRHFPTSASGTQASEFVCRCNVIPEVQWVVTATDSSFLEITVVKYKSGEFAFLSKPSGVSVFLSSCLFAKAVSCCNSYEVETECPNPFNKSITLVEPVQCLTVIASATCFGVGSPPPLMIRTQYLGRLRPISSQNFHFQCPHTHQRLVLLQVQ